MSHFFENKIDGLIKQVDGLSIASNSEKAANPAQRHTHRRQRVSQENKQQNDSEQKTMDSFDSTSHNNSEQHSESFPQNFQILRATKEMFSKPDELVVIPQLGSMTMKQINNWKCPSEQEFHPKKGSIMKSAAHVAILHYNESEDKIYVALHQRSDQLWSGKNKLGFPGGIADTPNEDIYDNVIRELNEECFKNVDLTVLKQNKHLLHVMSASRSYPHVRSKYYYFYAIFALFVNDKDLIHKYGGPMEKSEWELKENKALNMTKENGYHQFFSFRLDYQNNNVNNNFVNGAEHWSARVMNVNDADSSRGTRGFVGFGSEQDTQKNGKKKRNVKGYQKQTRGGGGRGRGRKGQGQGQRRGNNQSRPRKRVLFDNENIRDSMLWNKNNFVIIDRTVQRLE